MTLVAGSLVVLLAFTGFHAVFIAKTYLPPEAYRLFESSLYSSTWRLFGVGIMYIAVVTLAAIFISHRMVGPAHRLVDEIKKHIQSGHSKSPIRVREGDELEDVVRAINELIEHTSQR